MSPTPGTRRVSGQRLGIWEDCGEVPGPWDQAAKPQPLCRRQGYQPVLCPTSGRFTRWAVEKLPFIFPLSVVFHSGILQT